MDGYSKFDFCFLLKSFGEDIKYTERLIESINQLNRDSIETFIVIPKSDAKLFTKFKTEFIHLIFEEEIPSRLAKAEFALYKPGYINQAVIKLAFHRLGIADHYLCLDSDFEFIREFRKSDFICSNGQPYTVLVEDNDLKIDKIYWNQYAQYKDESLKNILTYLDMNLDEVWLTCNNGQIFSSQVLRDMDQNLLYDGKLDYLDLLEISPYEFSWYNFYLQKIRIPLRVREPFFKIIHTISQCEIHQRLNITKEDLCRGYLGVCVNSNFQGNFGPINLDDNYYRTATHFIKYHEILIILIKKMYFHLYKLVKILTRVGNVW